MAGLNHFGRWLLGILLGGAFWVCGIKAVAQVTPDTTLPSNSNVQINGNTFNITEGTARGLNLFHSFQQFSVPTRGEAFFNNAVDIQNIISRVTGGSISNIDGLIRTRGSANLFLINPNGIVFGRNASLNVGGSFVASTANAIQFGNLGIFSAVNPEAPSSLLTIHPSALLFNQIAVAPIQNNSQGQSGLTVPNGRSLLLVGGDINVNRGRLNAFGGRVELGGLAGTGAVGLNGSGNNLSLNFPTDVALANVSLTNGAEVNVASGGGGSIAIHAQDINVLGGTTLRAGISPSLFGGNANAQAGDVNLTATGTVRVENSSIYNAVFGSGNGGSLRVDAGKLMVQDGVIATATLSGGRGGDLIVNAKDVELSGSSTSDGTILIQIPVGTSNFPVDVPIGLFSASINVSNLARGGGNAGDLTIQTERLSVRDGAVVSASTTTTGRGGNLTVNASDFIELSGTSAVDFPGNPLTLNRFPSSLDNSTSGRGIGGDLTIKTGRLIVRDGAWVITGTAGQMPGGELTVTATDSVELSGTASATGLPSVLSSGTQGSGPAKNLTINTRQLRVSDGGIISAGTSSSGRGGELTIHASESVELIGTSRQPLSQRAIQQLIGFSGAAVFENIGNRPFPSGVITGTSGNGNAGNLTINTGRLLIKDGAQASVSTVGSGNAGSLTVRASSVELSGISQQSFNPNEVNDIIGRSLLTTAVSQNSTGNGGSITVETNSLNITDGAGITASTSGQGNAGNIFVSEANSVSVSSNGLISTAVNPQAVGRGGNIDINTSTLSVVSGALISANTQGEGDAGSITVTASTVETNTGGQFRTSTDSGSDAGDIIFNVTEGITLTGSNSGLFAQTSGAGSAGNLMIETGRLLVDNGAQVSASTSSQGTGGTLTVNAPQSVSLNGSGSRLTTATTASGAAGNLQINTNQLQVQNGAEISASTAGLGQGGTLTVNAPELISLTGSGSRLTTATTASGAAGNLQINTNQLQVQNGAEISASTAGSGQGGTLTVNAPELISLIGSGSRLTTETTGSGAGGTLQITTNQLQVQDGAEISASTAGLGQGGILTLTAPQSFSLTGSGSRLTTETTGEGAGGTLQINTNQLQVQNGAEISASTAGLGRGGSLEVNAPTGLVEVSGAGSRLSTETEGTNEAGSLMITARQLRVQNGGQVSASTSNQGSGGTLSVNASESVELSGRNSGLLTQATQNATGNAGSLTINTPQLLVQDEAVIGVNSLGTGTAGNLTANTRSIRLDNATLTADTRSNITDSNTEQATINLNASDFLLMRRGSRITTNASGSNVIGGNINIDTKYLIASGNSDISANSNEFFGGRVRIDATGIFGIQPRDTQTPDSDITATGGRPELRGSVEVNTSVVDFTLGLVELPTSLTDASRIIGASCAAVANMEDSEFIVTGRGGLPPSPDEPLNSDAVWTDTRIPNITAQPALESTVKPTSNNHAVAVVPATGWVFNDRGEVTLISQVSKASGGSTSASCGYTQQ